MAGTSRAEPITYGSKAGRRRTAPRGFVSAISPTWSASALDEDALDVDLDGVFVQRAQVARRLRRAAGPPPARVLRRGGGTVGAQVPASDLRERLFGRG